MKEQIAILVSIGLLATSPGVTLAQETSHSLEQVLVESAQTSADHTALAHYFRGKAAEARAEAERHERMGRSYLQGKIREREAYQRHCRNIAGSLKEQAAEFDALAAMHEAAAKAAE